MDMKKTYLSIILSFVIILAGCYNTQNPLTKEIAADQSEEDTLPIKNITIKQEELSSSLVIGNFTLKKDELSYIIFIEKCIYKNKAVYFFPEPYGSNDMMSKLVDKDNNIICFPSGGFEGNGNRKGCIDFSRKDCEVIWKNPSLP